MSKIVEHECKALGIPEPRLSIEPGRAIVGPAMCTVYEVGTVKQVALDGGASRTYVSVDGGMSDNIRTALYDADYSCTLAPGLPTRRRSWRGSSGSTARPATSSSRTSSCRRTCAGGPGGRSGHRAYCRSMASNYNHVPRPRWSRYGTARRESSYAARLRTTCWQPTWGT